MARNESGRTGTGDPDGGSVSAASVTLTLGPRMTYAETGAFLDALRAARDTTDVVIDATEVEQMSAATVLSLVSFLNARANVTPPAAVKGASGAFVDAFSDLGLFPQLMRMEFRT